MKDSSKLESPPREQPPGLIRGTVAKISPDGVLVDIGGDSSGFLPFALAAQTSAPLEVGETVEVAVAGESPDERPLLSSLSVKKPRSWDQLEAAFNTGTPVLGEVLGATKGGLAVDVGVWAFMPASRSGTNSKEEMESLVGKHIQSLVREFDKMDRNVVLDRSSVVDADRAKTRTETLAQLKVGDRVRGRVKTLRDFGAFVDLGGIDGLLRARDIAWERVRDPADFLRLGEEVEVEVLRIDPSKQRIGVGLKQIHPQPPRDAAERAESGPEPKAQLAGRVAGMDASRRQDEAFAEMGQDFEESVPDAPTELSNESLGADEAIDVVKPQGWDDLEAAFHAGCPVLGTVTGTIKGGLSVDVGVHAFMPASRSGARSARGVEALIGQQVQARIHEFDRADRNVVLDRRSVLDGERTERHLDELARFNVGDRVRGRVQKVVKFGAFVDLGGIDGLLHVKDIAWQHVRDPADFLREGQEVEVEILHLDRTKGRIRVGMKQLQREPWSTVGDSIKVNARIRGTVTEVKDFGAFVEIAPGVEGLLHVADMSDRRYVNHPSEIVSAGDVVEVTVMEVNVAQKRVKLKLTQDSSDPWQQLGELHSVGSSVSATVRKVTSFGAFVEVLDGVEGLLRVSDITSKQSFNTPSEVLHKGQQVRVKILEMDIQRQLLKVGMSQLEQAGADAFPSQVRVGATVTGRVVELDDYKAIVEIANGVRGVCALTSERTHGKGPARAFNWGGSLLRSMLRSALKRNYRAPDDQPSAARLTKGSVHSFRVKRLDAPSGKIELART